MIISDEHWIERRWICTLTKEDIGYVTIMMDPEFAIICNLFVVVEFRSQGEGSELFAAAMELTRQVPTYVDVCCFDTNGMNDKQLFDFYEARGFKRVGDHPFSMVKGAW